MINTKLIFSCLLILGITHALTLQEQCTLQSDCTSCIQDPHCGWCDRVQKCVPGNSTGPIFGHCKSWNFYTCAYGPSSSPTYTPTGSNCPQSNVNQLLGGYNYAGFCWYFTTSFGNTCDTICANVNGQNLANSAVNAFQGANQPISTDVTSVIYSQYSNPGNWSGPTTLHGNCKTLGWTYIVDLSFFGKDTSNSLQCGTFPGDNGHPQVSPVCPCFNSTSTF